jgi:hypothetical protein
MRRRLRWLGLVPIAIVLFFVLLVIWSFLTYQMPPGSR